MAVQIEAHQSIAAHLPGSSSTDDAFVAAVRVGLAEADRGEFVDDAEIAALFETMPSATTLFPVGFVLKPAVSIDDLQCDTEFDPAGADDFVALIRDFRGTISPKVGASA
jgi:hypothetical protein